MRRETNTESGQILRSATLIYNVGAMSKRKRTSVFGLKDLIGAVIKQRRLTAKNRSTVFIEQEISKRPCYFGCLPAEEVIEFLVHDGDFLIRKLNYRGEIDCTKYCISVKWRHNVHHINLRWKLVNSRKEYLFLDKSFPTVDQLIAHYTDPKLASNLVHGVKLKTPILRPEYFIQDSQIQMLTKIGEGNFGEVWQAKYTKTTDGKTERVAVKVMKNTAAMPDYATFFDECRKLRQLNHEHVVHFVGITVDNPQIKMVMELCEKSLPSLLKENANISWLTKTKICLHVSTGMQYLAKKGLIHRDLAARNCLIKERIVKITDLGMAREGGLYNMGAGIKSIPVKWTAPDAYKNRCYNEKSDVWSFGVLMWEVSTNGGSPYAELQMKSMDFGSELIEFLENGNRLEAPSDCPKELTKLMLDCMRSIPEERPQFSIIQNTLLNILRAQGGNENNILL